MMSAYGAGWPLSAHKGLPEKLLWKSATLAGFFLLRHASLFGSHLSMLLALHAAGRLRVPIDGARFVGLAAAPDAVARLHGGRSSGKVTLQVATQLPPGVAPVAEASSRL